MAAAENNVQSMGIPAPGERPNKFKLEPDGEWLYIGSEVSGSSFHSQT